MKKIFSILLLLSFLLSSFACSESSDTNIPDKDDVKNTVSADTTASVIEYEMDDLPETLDLEGQTVRFLSEHQVGHNIEITVSEETAGDPVINSVFYREQYIEERFGVNIENTVCNVDTVNFHRLVELQAASGEELYHVISSNATALTGYIFNDYLTDLYTVDNFNFEKPWWSDSFTEAVEVDDSLYLASGSLSLYTLRSLIAVYYNKALVERYSASDSELLELYDIVDRGDWTIDKMAELGANIYEDLNGNSEKDEDDLYGIGFMKASNSINSIWSSFDIGVLSATDDGWFELDVNTDKLYSALDKINDIFHNNVGVNTDIHVLKFPEDKMMFFVEGITFADNAYFRDMNSDYGIIPFPKYNENQKEYYSYAPTPTAYAIPRTTSDPDAAALVLEAMSAYAYRDTVPKYLDTVLKGRYMSDPQSREMIDLVVNGLKYDASHLYSGTIGVGIQSTFCDLLYENKTTYASSYAKSEREFEKRLQTYKKILAMYD